MDQLLAKKVSLKKVSVATVIVLLGLLGLFYAPPIIAIFSLAVTGLIGLTIVHGSKATQAGFGKPNHPIKIVLKYFILNWIVSMAVALFLNYVLGWHLQGNPVNDQPSLILLVTLPIMLMGEELFSIYFLSIFSSKISLPLASISSAVIFGLIHFSTYYDGSIVKTLVHILFIQGIARILFNQAAIKSNSIWVSWTIHLLFDLTSIAVAFLFA